MKKVTLVSALQDYALTWYITYYMDNLMSTLADIQTVLNKEFIRPKSEAQLVVGFKEITMKCSKMPWDLD